jgi:tRNA uridine 5-carbamoylmethylation protein Kti12
MKVINLFAGPGAGKSTVAAGLFHLMKLDGYKVELVTEYAKDIVWAGRHKELDDQLYITAKQHHRIFLLKDKVDYCVTDSPLLLSLVYCRMMPQSFFPFVKDLFHEYENYAVILKRTKPYVLFGRTQTEDEARALDGQINTLVYSQVPPNMIFETDGGVLAPEHVLNWIKEQ